MAVFGVNAIVGPEGYFDTRLDFGAIQRLVHFSDL